jgi:hypothetical protein
MLREPHPGASQRTNNQLRTETACGIPQSIRPWVADQITDRLWVQKTGSVLNNRRIKARMFRAFRMAFTSPSENRCERFHQDLFFVLVFNPR